MSLSDLPVLVTRPSLTAHHELNDNIHQATSDGDESRTSLTLDLVKVLASPTTTTDHLSLQHQQPEQQQQQQQHGGGKRWYRRDGRREGAELRAAALVSPDSPAELGGDGASVAAPLLPLPRKGKTLSGNGHLLVEDEQWRQSHNDDNNMVLGVTSPNYNLPDETDCLGQARDLSTCEGAIPIEKLTQDKVQLGSSSIIGPTEAQGLKYCRGHVTVYDVHEVLLPQVKMPEAYPGVDEAMEALPITRAIIKGDNCLVLESIRQGESPNYVCSKTGQTYLHLIARGASSERELHWVPMVYQLSNAGVDMNPRDKKGRSPALIAIKRKLVHILAALLKCGEVLGEAELEEAESVRGETRNYILETVRRFTPPYWEAIRHPSSSKVQRLVKAWARINISKGGQTLVEVAKQTASDPEVVRLLLQNEASVELAHAVMAGDETRVRLMLCDGGADLATSDHSVRSPSLGRYTPLSLPAAARKFGHHGVLRLLQERGANGPATTEPETRASGSQQSRAHHRGKYYDDHDDDDNEVDGQIPRAPYHKGGDGTGGTSSTATSTSAMCVVL